MRPSRHNWDYLILTAPNNRQAAAYEEQVRLAAAPGIPGRHPGNPGRSRPGRPHDLMPDARPQPRVGRPVRQPACSGAAGFVLIVCRPPQDASCVRKTLASIPRENPRARFFDFAINREGLVVAIC